MLKKKWESKSFFYLIPNRRNSELKNQEWGGESPPVKSRSVKLTFSWNEEWLDFSSYNGAKRRKFLYIDGFVHTNILLKHNIIIGVILGTPKITCIRKCVPVFRIKTTRILGSMIKWLGSMMTHTFSPESITSFKKC